MSSKNSYNLPLPEGRGFLYEVKSIDELLKKAELEMLLKNMATDAAGRITVEPVRCPAVDRATDFGRNSEGEPACMFQGKSCRYFNDAGMSMNSYKDKMLAEAASRS